MPQRRRHPRWSAAGVCESDAWISPPRRFAALASRANRSVSLLRTYDELPTVVRWVGDARMSFHYDDHGICLLYTSDAADERSSVDLGGRRIIKKKKKKK